jgi:hypothetical protein
MRIEFEPGGIARRHHGFLARRKAEVAALAFMAILGLLTAAARGDEPRIHVLKAPEGALQPQAVSDAAGVVHLVYLKGNPAAADVFYVRMEAGQDRFSKPIRVNHQAGAAIAIGTIRGAQLALGRGGRVHVAWNGSSQAKPRNFDNSSPMLYTRLNDAQTAFEPERNLMTHTTGLDGGGTVAADGAGRVVVAWHGYSEGDPSNEMGRRLWVARSNDEGRTFAPEVSAMNALTGACGCCSTRALATREGTLSVLYRAATDGVRRDIVLLTAPDGTKPFRWVRLQPWRTDSCPMSSASLTVGGTGTLAAWETRGQVYFARVDLPVGAKIQPIPAPGPAADRKHPAIASNAQGETVLVWTEGTSWQKGGALAWQVFDPQGRPASERGRLDDAIPVWGLATVVARPDGGFTIIH